MRSSGFKFLTIGIIMVLIILVSGFFLPSREMSVSDEFEDLTLSNAWSRSKFLPQGLTIQHLDGKSLYTKLFSRIVK